MAAGLGRPSGGLDGRPRAGRDHAVRKKFSCPVQRSPIRINHLSAAHRSGRDRVRSKVPSRQSSVHRRADASCRCGPGRTPEVPAAGDLNALCPRPLDLAPAGGWLWPGFGHSDQARCRFRCSPICFGQRSESTGRAASAGMPSLTGGRARRPFMSAISSSALIGLLATRR